MYLCICVSTYLSLSRPINLYLPIYIYISVQERKRYNLDPTTTWYVMGAFLNAWSAFV